MRRVLKLPEQRVQKNLKTVFFFLMVVHQIQGGFLVLIAKLLSTFRCPKSAHKPIGLHHSNHLYAHCQSYMILSSRCNDANAAPFSCHGLDRIHKWDCAPISPLGHDRSDFELENKDCKLHHVWHTFPPIPVSLLSLWSLSCALGAQQVRFRENKHSEMQVGKARHRGFKPLLTALWEAMARAWGRRQ